MRSLKEITFRLNQEAANLRMLAFTPGLPPQEYAPLARLPGASAVVERLRGTAFAREVESLAERILRHQFPIFGTVIETGPDIRWRRDYIHGVESGTAYFRRVPYLDFSRIGDHKVIWELNRHQHLVALAQAFRLTGRDEFCTEILGQLESWWEANPYGRGINWTSALEAAFRALSWIWVYHLVGERMEPRFRQRFLTELYRHGRYIANNLSIYFSPNTHLLGEAVVLHALGVLFPGFPRARKWAEQGARLVREQMDFQVRDDGTHFEQSAYYHVYALDMFLFDCTLADPPDAFRTKVLRMAEYLAALVGPAGRLPGIGDDDGGRLFHPYGRRDEFGRATLATLGWSSEEGLLHQQAAWWFGTQVFSKCGQEKAPRQSRLFPRSGTVVMNAGDVQILVDAGPFGHGSGGHSHSDSLSLVARLGAEEILIDPGTYTYVTSPEWRNWFRGSAAHNTIRIDAADQAVPIGPFRWTGKPEVEIQEWASTPQHDYLDAVWKPCHRRRVLFIKPHLLVIIDEISGLEGEHLVEQFWHLGEDCTRLTPHSIRIGSKTQLVLSEPGELTSGWRSRVYGVKEPAPVVRASLKAALPATLAAVLDFSGCSGPLALSWQREDDGISVLFRGTVVRFPAHGQPNETGPFCYL